MVQKDDKTNNSCTIVARFNSNPDLVLVRSKKTCKVGDLRDCDVTDSLLDKNGNELSLTVNPRIRKCAYGCAQAYIEKCMSMDEIWNTDLVMTPFRLDNSLLDHELEVTAQIYNVYSLCHDFN